MTAMRSDLMIVGINESLTLLYPKHAPCDELLAAATWAPMFPDCPANESSRRWPFGVTCGLATLGLASACGIVSEIVNSRAITTEAVCLPIMIFIARALLKVASKLSLSLRSAPISIEILTEEINKLLKPRGG